MYFPYLRGRQFELIALREYAQERGDQNNVIPIIEPVRSTFNSMKLALVKLIFSQVKFSIILNPEVGELPDSDEIISSLSSELSDKSLWIPAFIAINNLGLINDIIIHYNLNNIMLICRESLNIDQSEFGALIDSGKVQYLVTAENRTLKRKLKDKNIEIIRLDDNFKGLKRNSDYISVPDEKFSEEHLFYIEDGYQGFSDYTVVVSDFSEGGAAPYAVAIHLTYTKESEDIWIQHFVSDTNDDRSNIQGKFAEAAEKAVNFLNLKGIHSYASEELRDYYRNSTYPGLGMIKKISIKHHLELVNGLLAKKE